MKRLITAQSDLLKTRTIFMATLIKNYVSNILSLQMNIFNQISTWCDFRAKEIQL